MRTARHSKRLAAISQQLPKNRPIVIAHRGASGYLPEHTLEAKALAHEMGADYLEQDIVATRDNELVVMHDIHLDRVTDVAERFPGRCRADGRYYVRDFDFAEVRSLRVLERRNQSGEPVYPNRFAGDTGQFQVQTLQDEIEFIHDLNRRSGRRAGIYPEIKRPAWHKSEGVDLTPRVLDALGNAGYTERGDPVYLQCFDAGELTRIRHSLGSELKLIQLIGVNEWLEGPTDYDELVTDSGLRKLSRTVDGIGPWLPLIYDCSDRGGRPTPNSMVASAHEKGLCVHPFTYRSDDLPPGFTALGALVRFSWLTLGIDGMFTDFPDKVIDCMKACTGADKT
jgi:glycerophosphoryl diester phosphodiesterase